jgi:hypothetical protein
MPWKGFTRRFELKIDTGASPDSRDADNYHCDALLDVDQRLSDAVMYMLSIWDTPFRLALRDPKRPPETGVTERGAGAGACRALPAGLYRRCRLPAINHPSTMVGRAYA